MSWPECFLLQISALLKQQTRRGPIYVEVLLQGQVEDEKARVRQACACQLTCRMAASAKPGSKKCKATLTQANTVLASSPAGWRPLPGDAA